MRVLRGTLTFVLGMIIGIILFVIAIGGAVAIIGTSITVGQLQGNFTDEEIISSDSQLYNQTLLEAIQSVMSDVQALDSLTMRTLYEHYGIELLNGVSGIDFTTKEFYDTNLSTVINDMSIVVNSFTLNDISTIAGVDFEEYNLPVLTDNLDNNIQTALDNILSSLNGDLSIRSINTNFGIDVGVEDNSLIKTLQDVSLSNFGSVVNAIELHTLINVDCDLFIPQGKNRVYQATDEYVSVPASELKTSTPAIGVETYYAGAVESKDSEGKSTWTIIENELRYVKKEASDGSISYVVDNSCYAEDFDAENSNKEFFKHVLYKQADTSSNPSDLAVLTYFNRIADIDGNNVTLKKAGFTALTELENIKLTSLSANPDGTITFSASTFNQVDADLFYMLDKTIKKDCLLRQYNEEEDKDNEDVVKREQSFIRVKKGESDAILQIVAPMTVSELQNADDFLNSLKVGDVVDTEAEDTAKVLKSLKDCKLTEIGTKINDLPLSDLIDIDDDSAPIMKAIKNHGCTLDNINEKINKFTIGEILDINYDEYLPCNATTCSHEGHYVQETITIPYNPYVHNESDKYQDGTGAWVVDIVKYRLERDTDSADTQRYNLNKEGTTAIAIQMMAKRGYTLDSIGTGINDMGFDELVRIKPTSSLIMRSLAKHGATLDNIDTIIDTLLIDEVIEIDADSATIMKSLQAKECTIKDLGNVAGTLTLAETTDIKFNEYSLAPEGSYGKYVKVVDTSRLVLYDANNPNFGDRYSKDEDGTLEIDGVKYSLDNTNGKFAHPFYFTLYNPATDGSKQTYNIVENSEASSKVLQRLAYTSIEDFSDEFDKLMLGDVLDIDIDILARDTSVATNKSYFYYDVANQLYMRQADKDLAGIDSKYQNFYVVEDGTSSSVLKRLAYVNIDKMSSAMELVVKDMMLSELVDIYTESAVSIRTDDSNPIVEEDMFIVKPVEASKDYTFVYNTSGKYIKRDYGFYPLTDDELAGLTSGTVSYGYGSIQTLNELYAAAENKNVYYKSEKDGVTSYTFNPALCAYVASQHTDMLKPIVDATTGKTDFELDDYAQSKLYSRVSGTNTAPKYTNDGTLYVLLNGVYQPYVASNLVHADLTIYQWREGTCYVEITTPDDGSGTYKYKGTDEATGVSKETLYAKQYCEGIFVQSKDTTKTLYVYVGGEYVEYDASKHGTDVITYEKVVGYLATANECYLKDNSGAYVSPLSHLGDRVSVEGEGNHQKSEKVLQTLANATIDSINDKIKTAKVGDLLEIESGSLFEEFADSTLTEVSTDLQNALKDWTIGDLARKANITSMQPEVKSALDGVTLDNFFKSLTYSSTAGIIVDLEKAYGF